MHVLPSDDATLREIGDFDVERLAQQLDTAHVRYSCLTLGQNSGYFNAPNAAYDRISGYQPGERCSARDLPLDLHRALSARNIRADAVHRVRHPIRMPARRRRSGWRLAWPINPSTRPSLSDGLP